MDTASLKSFATRARTDLIKEVGARVDVVLGPGSDARLEYPRQVEVLERLVAKGGRESLVERVAYTWFNRIVALRFMDANGYTGVGVVSPEAGQDSGQPEVLANAKAGTYDSSIVPDKTVAEVGALISGSRPSPDPQGEAYGLLLEAYCHHWHQHMDFMFEKEADYTDLLVPASLLSADSVRDRAVKVLTKEVCQDVEVIGWLYQFYISDRKDEVFAGFKKNKKAGAEEIPAATQLFTPHWIVRYLVENSLGRLWMLNRPSSGLASQMDYYIAPVDQETDFLKITKPEELTVIDPACGSGHMLTYAFDLLHAIYEEEGYAPADIPGLILTHNLYGTEIDARAGALAAFALTMKARARQRTFFTKQIEPNICVIEPISFTRVELDYLAAKDGDRHAEEAFWNQFAEADTLGSLIQPDTDLTAQLGQRLDTFDDDGDLYKAEALNWAREAIRQSEFLSPRYSVVVANPPYMGSKNMAPRLLAWAQGEYPKTRYDLFAMFIERSLELAVPNGVVAMVTMQSWMFLARFSDFRTDLVRRYSIQGMAHLGARAFESIGGEVVQVSATCVEKRRADRLGQYLRLVELDSPAEKATAIRTAATTGAVDYEFVADQSGFLKIPGTPIAYWASDALLGTFKTGKRVEDVAPVRQGFQTGDNDRFMRFWFEVSRDGVRFNATSTADFHSSGSRFAPYLKGGSFRKWFGNDEYVVAFDPASYSALGQLGNKLPSRSLYFRESITWSALSSGDFGARYAGAGSTFSAKGACAFPSSKLARDLVLAVFNSSVAGELLEFMGATLDFNVGSLREIPLPTDVSSEAERSLGELVDELIAIHRQDWNADESGPGFSENMLVSSGRMTSLRSIAAETVQRAVATTERVSSLQVSLDRLVSSLYGLPPGPEMGVTLRFATIDDPESKSAVNVRLIRDLISFAVGCMLGRYSLDQPGLILADQGATLQDYFAKVPDPAFVPDADNVIPIVDGDWFEDDIVERFRVFLKAAFGEECFEENLAFVTESLGVKTLRDYFVKSFYKDHVQRYKKRPIYWLFSSPKGSFNALVYLHRYTPTTVSTVLNEYLRAYQTKLDVRLTFLEGQIAGAATAKEVAQASKEAEKIRAVLVELKAYETDLYQLAQQQIALDLDDGVKVNYGKFGTALKDIGINKAGSNE